MRSVYDPCYDLKNDAYEFLFLSSDLTSREKRLAAKDYEICENPPEKD